MNLTSGASRLRRAAIALPIVAVVSQAGAAGAQSPAPTTDGSGGDAITGRSASDSLEFVGNLTDSRGVRQAGALGVEVRVHPEDQVRFGLTPENSTVRLPPVAADASGRFSVSVNAGDSALKKLNARGARLELVLAASIGSEYALSFTPLTSTGEERVSTAAQRGALADAKPIDISTRPVDSTTAAKAADVSAAASSAPAPGLCTQIGSPVRISNGSVTVGISNFAPDTGGWAIGWNYKRTTTTSTTVGVAFGVGGNYPSGSVTLSGSGSSSVGRETSLEGAALAASTAGGLGRKHRITVSRYLTKWNCLVSPSIPPPNNYAKAYTVHSGSWIADFAAVDSGPPAACTLTGVAGGTRNWTEIGPGSSITRDSQSSISYTGGFSGEVSYGAMTASGSLNTTTGFSTNSKVTVANTLTSGNKRLCGYTANRKPLFDNTQFVANPGTF